MIASFIMVSLDGFFEGGKPWEIDWHQTDEEFNEFAIEQLGEFDTLVFGRATYEGMAQYWPSEKAISSDPEIASRMNEAPKVVVSRSIRLQRSCACSPSHSTVNRFPGRFFFISTGVIMTPNAPAASTCSIT